MKPKDAGSVARPGVAPLLTAAAAVLLLAGFAPALGAQAWIIGPDIPVAAASFAVCPAVAMGGGADFEVVWNNRYSESHPIPQGIFVRHFDREGRPTHRRVFRLDSPDNLETSSALVAALPDSGYFVVWFEYRTRSAIAGRFLDSAGRPRGPVIALARGGHPVAAVVVDGGLLVAWKESPRGILRARRFDLAGRPLGGEMRLATLGDLGAVSLAPLADSFVAAWERWTGKSWVTETQRFSLAGEPLESPVKVSSSRLSGPFRVEVASDGGDRFAVAWTRRERLSETQTDDETRARFFDAGGASSPEAHPNELPAGNQEVMGLAMDGRGLALVTWHSDRNHTASALDVAGRFLTASGQPASKAFPLSQNLSGNDLCPAAATSGSDEWAVAWLKQGTGVFARRLVFKADSVAAE